MSSDGDLSDDTETTFDHFSEDGSVRAQSPACSRSRKTSGSRDEHVTAVRQCTHSRQWAADENEDTHKEVVKWWKNKRALDHIWRTISIRRGLHDITVVGDFFFERYAHFWQLLRNVHFSKWLPAVLITRIFFRGVYLLIVGVKRDDYHVWEWKIREGIRHSFNIENQESFFYAFYVDILIEIVFIALISKANNATFNRALTVRLKNWQWLALGVGALWICIARDIRLTQFLLHPNTLHRKTKSIIHIIGTIIIAMCDVIFVLIFAYILINHVVLGWHDLEIYRYRSKLLQERQSSEGALPNADDRDPIYRQMLTEYKNAEIIDQSCSSCLPSRIKSSARIDSASVVDESESGEQQHSHLVGENARQPRAKRRSRILLRARTAARNLQFVLLERKFAPEYVYREGDERSLLAALLHPPGACAGRFQAHDLRCVETVSSQFVEIETSLKGPLANSHRQKSDRRTKFDQLLHKSIESLRSKTRDGDKQNSTRRSAARMAQRTARTFTNDIFGGLWSQSTVDPHTKSAATEAQKRAIHLDRLHLSEEVDVEWQERVRNRTYYLSARLLMAVVMGWLLAVAVTALLAYGAYALEQYIKRRLNWISDTLDDVDEVLNTFAGANASYEIIDAVTDQVAFSFENVASSFAGDIQDTLVEAIEDSAEAVNTSTSAALNETIKSVITQITNATSAAIRDFDPSTSVESVDAIFRYIDNAFSYVEDYRDVLNYWLELTRRASSNFFRSGVIGAAVAFVLMNYSLLMMIARYRETTHRFRETGMIDEMDLIFDESMQEPASRSEWFWLIVTAPSAPYAVAFVGNAVSNMLIISAMVTLMLFIISGVSLFPGAVAFAGDFIMKQVGMWRYIYPAVYVIDWFYLNSFIADRTYIIHRSCFDMWDFVIGMWKLITGLFGGIIRIALIYIIATANTIRIDWTIFAGRIGWLDIGYNSFASVVMLTERHDNPSLSAASRLILSSVAEPYSRRTCAEHVLTFDLVGASRVLNAAEEARDLPDLFERVIMEDPDALSKVQRARVDSQCPENKCVVHSAID